MPRIACLIGLAGVAMVGIGMGWWLGWPVGLAVAGALIVLDSYIGGRTP